MNNNIDLLNKLDSLVGKDAEIHHIINQLREVLQLEENETNEEDLIFVPMNPLIKEAQDLGGAEAMAFGYNILGTVGVNALTQSTLAVSIAGPIVEKIGFFGREYIKAYRQKNKTGKPTLQGFKENISNGIKNLLVDIGVHDTIYTALMVYGITHQMFDARVLAIFSFLIALPPAILVKYSGNEILYYLQKNLTKLHGFDWEKYYEARFILDSHSDPKSLFEATANKFGLSNYNFSRYQDQYFDHRIPAFSDRLGTLKLRSIQDTATGNSYRNLEIAHTLARKDYLTKNSVYNFFYSRKEKGKKDLTHKDPDFLLKKYPYINIIKTPSKEIIFDREILHDGEIRITLDNIISPTSNQLKIVMEVKAFKDTKHLMETMKYIMSKGKVRLTTHGKKDLI